MRFLRWPFLTASAVLLTGGVFLARSLFATPGNVMPRDTFTTMVALTPPDLCHPESPNWCGVGIDGQGPFFHFMATPGATLPPQVYTYRPRGPVVNTVNQFGDGGIHAVSMFRELFERWARTGIPGGGGAIFQPGPPAFSHFHKLCVFGTAFILPMDVEISSIMMGAMGGYPVLMIAVDPTGNFEDFEFRYDAQ